MSVLLLNIYAQQLWHAKQLYFGLWLHTLGEPDIN